MNLMTLLLIMMMSGKRNMNPLLMMLLMGGLGGSSGSGMSLATSAGTMPINLGNAIMWSMMPKMGTFPAMLTGGVDAVIGQSMFKSPRRRSRSYRRSYRPRRRYY